MYRKYISFDSVAELEGVLEALKAIKEENRQGMKKYLDEMQIPYKEYPDGISVSLNTVSPQQMESYMDFFRKTKDLTEESYRKLGVVFVETWDNENEKFMLDIKERKN